MSDIMIPAVAEDGALYQVEKLRAHELGLPHLAISVFVFDGEHMLLQRRAIAKYHSGGLWTNTVCTHPHWDEDLGTCAERRLVEEMGLSLPLTPVGRIDYRADVGGGLIENEKVTLFTGEARRSDCTVSPNPDEVMEYRWMPRSEVLDWIATRPDDFTPWMKIYSKKRSFLFAQ